MTRRWPVRADNNAELGALITRGLPAGFGVAALALPVFYVAAEGGWPVVGGVLSLGIFAGAFVVGARVTMAAEARVRPGTEVVLDGDRLALATDAGPRVFSVSATRVQAGWYERVGSQRSMGAWLHLDDGRQQVNLMGHGSHAAAREAGMPMAEGGPPRCHAVVEMTPWHLVEVWKALTGVG